MNCYYRNDMSYNEQNKKIEGYANTVHIATPNMVDNSSWYMDSGASDHITHDPW